jgi:GNAT superfamily N-acetyltransferase
LKSRCDNMGNASQVFPYVVPCPLIWQFRHSGFQRRDDREAELRRMSVAADSRRRGIGRELLKTAEDFCRGQGYQHIHLTTVSHLKPAIALYQKAGYQLTGEDQYGQINAQHFVKYLSVPFNET